MASLLAHAIKTYARVVIKKDPETPEQLVRHLRRTMGNPPPNPPLPFGVRLDRFAGNGVNGDWLRVNQPRQTILYLHGGGYVCGKPKTYHNVCARFAKVLHADVYLPRYRLAPEHPFPAAVEDALASYELLLDKGLPASQITVMGDSAGGGLSLGLVLALRDKGLPLPKCVVAFSPYADLTHQQDSRSYNDKKDAMLSRRMNLVGKSLYGRTEDDRRNPYASPVFGEYHDFPPLLMTVCEEEILRDDTYVIAEKARLAGVEVELISRQDLLHVWPIFYPLLREARADVKKVTAFIQRH